MTRKTPENGPSRLFRMYLLATVLWIGVAEIVEHELELTLGHPKMLNIVEHIVVGLGTSLIIFLLSRDYMRQLSQSESVLRQQNEKLAATEEQLRKERRELERSESRFRQVVESSPVGILSLDGSGKVETWNPAAEKIFGWPQADVLGRLLPIVPQGEEAIFQKNLATIMSGGEMIGAEVIRKKRDGSPVAISVSIVRQVDDSGRPTGVLAVVEDIGERKKAADALRVSEEKYRLLFSQMLNGFMVGEIVINPDGHACDYVVEKVNPAFERVTGLKAEEVVGRRAREIFLEPDRSWIDFYGHVALTGAPARIEKFSHFFRKYFELQAYSPGPRRFAVIFSDITDRKEAESRLVELQLRQQAVLDNIPDLVWMKDCDSRFVIVNKAFADAAGRTSAEIVGMSDLELWPGDLAFEYRRLDRRVMHEGRSHRLEEPLEDTEKGRVWIETIKSPVTGENGSVIGTTGIARDITYRKKRDAERLLYEDQLTRLARELSSAEERERRRIARELHDQVGQTLVLGKMKVRELRSECDLRLLPLAETVQQVIDQCINEIRSITFQLSPPLLYEVSLEAAVEDLADRLQAQYGLPIVVDAAPEMPHLPEEKRVIIFQAVRELLLNTIKHAHATRASVTLEPQPEGILQVKVSDDGIGINETGAPGKTAGFGLFNIRERITSVRGHLIISSRAGGGVTANITVPAGRQEKPTSAEQGALHEHANSSRG